jgi:hypothetical protein
VYGGESMMDFYQVVGQVLELLQRQGRVSYRALKLQFHLDDDHVEGLKDELIYAQKVAVDEDNRVLVFVGSPEATTQTPAPSISATPASPGQDSSPLSYTPQHLTENIGSLVFPGV